ncbi:MAG: hypothetical protein N2738_08200 [Thermodesulfovibrionales bacterium]|nr:hypothetical protein [Thermodesulfovibrionales bacterium]
MHELAELLNKSLQEYEQKRYKEAEMWIDKLLIKDNQFEKALFLKAVICSETGRHDEASLYFSKTSNLSFLWLRLGLQIEQTDIDRALVCYDKVLSSNPSDNQALYLKGLLLEKKGFIDEASKCFRALNLMRDIVTKVFIPLGFFVLLALGSFMLISRGEHGLSFIVLISAMFCLFWLKRDGFETVKMFNSKLSAK